MEILCMALAPRNTGGDSAPTLKKDNMYQLPKIPVDMKRPWALRSFEVIAQQNIELVDNAPIIQGQVHGPWNGNRDQRTRKLGTRRTVVHTVDRCTTRVVRIIEVVVTGIRDGVFSFENIQVLLSCDATDVNNPEGCSRPCLLRREVDGTVRESIGTRWSHAAPGRVTARS